VAGFEEYNDSRLVAVYDSWDPSRPDHAFYLPPLGGVAVIGGTTLLALVTTVLPIGRVLRVPPVENIGVKEWRTRIANALAPAGGTDIRFWLPDLAR